MAKLQAKGKNDYVTLRQIPAERAQAETQVIFAAFREAVEGLVVQAANQNTNRNLQSALFTSYVALRRLSEMMSEELAGINDMLGLVNQKMMELGVK